MRPFRHSLHAAALLLSGAALGCDLPLDLPSWDTHWTLVVAADTVDIDTLLPAGVRREEGAFVVDDVVSAEDVRLEEVCEFCTCFSGPIPALEITPFDWAVPLPLGISAVTLRSGVARIVLENRIAFDLLDSGEGEMGHLELVLLDLRTGLTLDSIRISQPFPPGGTLEASFPLAGLEIHRDVTARVRGQTPGSRCDVALTPDMGIRTEVTLAEVVAERVEIVLRDADLNLPTRRVELPGPLAARLRPGETRLRLDVELESTVPVAVEGLLSVAGRPQDLYTGEAALYTPLPISPAPTGGATQVRRTFLLDVTGLEGASALHLSTANRVSGNRELVVVGTERVAWTVTLHAEVPNR